jgi:hypothetical protein
VNMPGIESECAGKAAEKVAGKVAESVADKAEDKPIDKAPPSNLASPAPKKDPLPTDGSAVKEPSSSPSAPAVPGILDVLRTKLPKGISDTCPRCGAGGSLGDCKVCGWNGGFGSSSGM